MAKTKNLHQKPHNQGNLTVIPDNETAVDLLYYEAVVGTIRNLINSTSDEPLTIGIHGDWGAGKSSILAMLEKAFSSDNQTLCIRFNGWLFQGFEDTKSVLLETILEDLKARNASEGVAEKAKQLLKRVNWMKVARRMGGLTFNVAMGLPSPDQINDMIQFVKDRVAEGTKIDGTNIDRFAAEAENYFKDAEPDSITSHIHAFRKEFTELLKEADVKRLVVVVDDLDRCLPETAIETLEAIRLFLFVPGVTFVIAADEAMIEYAVNKHFPDLPPSKGLSSYARNYLEKLIQVPFRLPPLGYVETRTFITLLIAEMYLPKDDWNFIKLVELAREVLRRPWGGDDFTREKINEVLDEVPDEIEGALQIADQIAPLLTDGSRGNPRQIKRFLNTMSLRLAIAQQRSIQDDIKMPVLAKLMLAERFETSLFSRIEREATESGKSSLVKDLEDFVRVESEVSQKRAEKLNSEKTDPDSLEEDIRNNEWARRWAKLEPKLAEHDLRPYLFISRDQRAVFSASSSLGLMEEWVDKLYGSRLGAQAAASEIALIQPGEAERVFNAVTTRVRAEKDYRSRPRGFYGIAELCKVHKNLQIPTVALLEDLPIKKLGAWVVSGWKEIFTEKAAKDRFDDLVRKWADQEENNGLKRAASLALKSKEN